MEGNGLKTRVLLISMKRVILIPSSRILRALKLAHLAIHRAEKGEVTDASIRTVKRYIDMVDAEIGRLSRGEE